MSKKENLEMVPVNRRKFILSYSNIPEDLGYSYEQVREMLDIVENYEDHEAFYDPDFVNDIGTFFEGGVGVEKNIEQAVYWYERSVAMGDDLAKSNLADILRKGSQGYPKDLKRAFELYKSCGLPYAFYRVGEFYENGWGVEKAIKSKQYGSFVISWARSLSVAGKATAKLVTALPCRS